MNQFAQRLDAAIATCLVDPAVNRRGCYFDLFDAWHACSRQDQQAATLNHVGATFASLADLVDALRSRVVLR